MEFFRPFSICCKDSSSQTSRLKRLESCASTTDLTCILATCAASALVVASAGYGAVFAWQSGSHYGVLLGCLTVLFAVALEILKPLALATAIRSFRSCDLVRGAALVILGLVAVTYSLTSELSLMAGARGDAVATRSLLADSASDLRSQRNRAEAELTALGTTRPSATIKVEVDALLAGPRVGDCTAINGPRSQAACPKVAELRAELGKAERHQDLETLLAKPIQTTGTAVGKADPGASVLATYLSALQINIDVKVLTEWLLLVPVLSLEVGSALAGIVVQAVARKPKESHTERVKSNISEQPVLEGGSPPEPAAISEVLEQSPSERQKVKEAIVAQLKASGGSLSSSSRGLAKKVGANRNTLRRAVNGLVLGGVVCMEASKSGTFLRLLS